LATQFARLTEAAVAAAADTAPSTVRQVALGWWDALLKSLGASPATFPPAPFKGALAALGMDARANARKLGQDMAALPVADASAQIGHLYCRLMPPTRRSAQGVFYTPTRLVHRLLDGAEAAGHDWSIGKAIDPSCGSGAFLVEAASRMTRALGPADPAILIAAVSARLQGWDVDPFAAWLAQVSVEAFLLAEIVASGKRLAAITTVKDSLATWTGHEGAYALVMGNPAFGKIKDNAALRTRFARSLYGHPNLYGLFTDLAVHLAAPQRGIIAYLTPTSYLGGKYFKSLRRLLAVEAPPIQIDIVDSRQDVFEDVLQEVALNVFRRGSPLKAVRCSVIHVEADGLRFERAGSFDLPADPESAWILPRRSGDAVLVDRMNAMPCRLSDWGYTVSTGPLVWNRHKTRLHNDAKTGSVPIVWAEAVDSCGIFRLRSEKRNHAAFYQPSGPNDSNLVRASCLLVQRTTAKEQHRRLISALLPSALIEAHGAVAIENHLNMILPSRRKPPVPMKAVAAFFATGTADRIMRCINASVAVSASEIEAMPLPSPDVIIAAMASADPGTTLARLYGIEA
jgi:adenine-specific DNA-methyltransferase